MCPSLLLFIVMVVVIIVNIILGLSKACGDQQRPSELSPELKMSPGSAGKGLEKREAEALKKAANFFTFFPEGKKFSILFL